MSQKRRRVDSVFLAQSIGLGGLNKWEDKSQKSVEEVEGKKRLSNPSWLIFHND